MDSRVLTGLLLVVAISLLPVAILSFFKHAKAIYEYSVVAGRRMHLLHTPPVLPAGPPLQELAADLRRLRPEARSPGTGVPMAQQDGTVAAYDAALVTTARALDVPTTLTELPDGYHREAERLRLERALEQAGLTWRLRQD
jgi:hypothetical protein